MAAQKIISIEPIGDISISKRRGQKGIRITINGTIVNVTQPAWLPFSAGEAFARSRVEWIRQHTAAPSIYTNGQKIGHQHTLLFLNGDKIGSRVGQAVIRITIPPSIAPSTPEVQATVKRAIIKALRQEGEAYLPSRTHELARAHGFSFKSVSIKLLKRRWGSCNSRSEITYNLRLMSLSLEQIDYVILHELTHTLHMNHSAEFWNHMESVLPGAKKIAKVVRRYHQ